VKRLRNALGRLFRVNRGRTNTPDSIVPFIRIVKDRPCPYCGSKFPNRPKVHDKEGWWWRCYTEDCPVGYHQPEHMLVELRTGETISYEGLWRRFKVFFRGENMDVLNEEVKEFQQRLEAILKEFLEQGSIEVYGNPKIVVTSFDRPSRIAFRKGNTIYVSIKARQEDIRISS